MSIFATIPSALHLYLLSVLLVRFVPFFACVSPRSVAPPSNETQSMWEHFLECVRSHNRSTLCPPELGAAAVTIAALGVESFRSGQMLTWDKETRRPATPNGSAWAANWETRSQNRERFAGLQPPAYMDLAGERDA